MLFSKPLLYSVKIWILNIKYISISVNIKQKKDKWFQVCDFLPFSEFYFMIHYIKES